MFKHSRKAIASWICLTLALAIGISYAQLGPNRPINAASAPFLVRAADQSKQFLINATNSAVDYICYSAGQTGIGGLIAVCSDSDTNAPLTISALGTGAVNIGSGAYATPILAFDDAQSGYPTYPTFTRFLNAGSIVSASLSVPATGSIVARPTAGINSYGARVGNAAVDLQICTPFDDTSPYRIASGSQSFAANCNNRPSATNSAALGNFNDASANQAFAAGGTSSVANGVDCITMGSRASCLGVQGARALGGGDFFSSSGSAQIREYVAMATVTNTSANRLTSSGAAAAASTLPFALTADNRSTLILGCDIFACVTSSCGDNIKNWTFGPTTIRRQTGVASTDLDSTTVTAGTTIGTVGTIAITAAADTTNAALNLSATASDDTDFHVVAYCRGIDVR